MLNNNLKWRLFSTSKLIGWKQHITIGTHVIKTQKKKKKKNTQKHKKKNTKTIKFNGKKLK